MGGGPEYYVDRKLGKGGFGQVFIGRRVATTKQRDGANANLVSWKGEVVVEQLRQQKACLRCKGSGLTQD